MTPNDTQLEQILADKSFTINTVEVVKVEDIEALIAKAELKGRIVANVQWLEHVKKVHKLVNISQLEKEIAQLQAREEKKG